MKRTALVLVALTAFSVSTSAYAASSPEQQSTTAVAQATTGDQTADSTQVPQNETVLPWVEPDP